MTAGWIRSSSAVPVTPRGSCTAAEGMPTVPGTETRWHMIRKMEKNGGNAIYFIAVRTHGGDAWKSARDEPETYPDDLHNPWINQDPEQGLNEKILDQWDQWFDEMDRHGIVIYFFLYDDAIDVAKEFGWALDGNGNLDPREKAFVQAIVNRFKHHRNLIWCPMEEGQEIGANWQVHISRDCGGDPSGG